MDQDELRRRPPIFEIGWGMVAVVMLGFAFAYGYGHIRGRRYHDRD